MYRAIVCLTQEHTAWALPLAAVVCWVSCHTASRLSQESCQSRCWNGTAWLAAAGFAVGAGTWSTHFIAMLGYDPGVGVGYDLRITLLSLAISIAASIAALSIAREAIQIRTTVVAGMVLGLGIAAMHFTGMAGVNIPGNFAWHSPLVIAAVLIGLGLACAAFVVAVRAPQRHRHIMFASVLAAAIASLHFLAMAAAEVVPDPSLGDTIVNLPRGVLALTVAGVMLAVLAFSALGLLVEHLRRINSALRQREALLKDKSDLLDAVLENMDQGLLMLDGSGVVQVCNARAIALLELSPQMMRGRPTYEAVREYQITQHDLGKSSEAMKPWVLGGEIDLNARAYEHERPNGTILEIRTVPLPDGGVVRTFTDVTQRRAGERALQESERRHRLLAENTTDVIVWCDLDTTRRYVSPAVRSVLGYRPEDLIGTRPLDFAHPDDVDASRRVLSDLIAGRVEQAVTTQRYRRGDGAWVWIEASCKLTRDPSGASTGYVAALRDVTERKTVEERVRLSEERLALALDSGSDGLWDWDLAANSIQFSDSWFGMFGYGLGEVALHTRAWVQLAHPDDAERARRLLVEHIKGLTPTFVCEYRLRKKTGEYAWILARGKVVARDASGRATRIVGTQIDISARKEVERQIAHMAAHDALTSLPNRILFRKRLDQELAVIRSHGGAFAVLACDLDRFKNVNDTLGHPAGDKLLCVIAERLRSVTREVDTVARLGGDEFAIILSQLDDPLGVSLAAQRVIEAVNQPIDLGGQTAMVGVSIGIAWASPEAADADALFRNADIALYRAKAEGRNTYSFYEPGMDVAVAERDRLERDLRAAVRDGGFSLHYQPIVRAGDGATSGFEALLRWMHSERGFISPGEFIPLAEATGLIVPLGEWVLREACCEAAGWSEEVRVAVNVSAVQFRRPGLEQAVVGALAASGLAPGRLELEITESVLMEDSPAAIACLHRLRGLGVRVALDDFGTGYSSLSYLRRFPFNKIKIDRSFIGDIGNPDTAAIVQAIVCLGVRLGAAITAEGVETAQQFERVREIGCTEVQGYLLGKPLPPSDARAFVRDWRGRSAA